MPKSKPVVYKENVEMEKWGITEITLVNVQTDDLELPDISCIYAAILLTKS